MSERPWKIYSGSWPQQCLGIQTLYFVTAFKYREVAVARARKLFAASQARPFGATVESPIAVRGPNGEVLRLWLDDHRRPCETVA